MLKSDEKKADGATAAALKCAYALMQQRIISNPKDMMGILLFGTQQSTFQDNESGSGSGFQYPHCYLLSDLDVPAAADVKRLRALVEDEQESSKLLVPSDEPVAMSNVLFCANQIFTTKAPNFSSRRLFLVTDNDNPHATSKELRSSAVVRAKDLYDLGVTIELFPISQPGQTFDRAKFYDVRSVPHPLWLLLTHAGHCLPFIPRRRCSGTRFFSSSHLLCPRRDFSSPVSTQRHPLQIRPQTRPLQQFTPGTRSRLSDFRQRLHFLQATGAGSIHLHLARRRDSANRHRHNDTCGPRHGAPR